MDQPTKFSQPGCSQQAGLTENRLLQTSFRPQRSDVNLKNWEWQNYCRLVCPEIIGVNGRSAFLISWFVFCCCIYPKKNSFNLQKKTKMPWDLCCIAILPSPCNTLIICQGATSDQGEGFICRESKIHWHFPVGLNLNIFYLQKKNLSHKK